MRLCGFAAPTRPDTGYQMPDTGCRIHRPPLFFVFVSIPVEPQPEPAPEPVFCRLRVVTEANPERTQVPPRLSETA